MEEFLQNYFKDESMEKIKYLYSEGIDNKSKVSLWYILILECSRKRILNPGNIFVLPKNLSEKFIFKNETPICLEKILEFYIKKNAIIYEKNGYLRQFCRIFNRDKVFTNKEINYSLSEDQNKKISINENLDENKNDICKIFERSTSINNKNHGIIYILKDLVFEWFEIIKKTVDSVIEEEYFISKYSQFLNKQELYLLLEILQKYKKIGVCKERGFCLIVFTKESDIKLKNMAILKSRIFKLKNFIESNKVCIENQNFNSYFMNQFVKQRNDILSQKISQADQFKDFIIQKITNLEQLSILKKFNHDFSNINNYNETNGSNNIHFINDGWFNIDSILSTSVDQENIKNLQNLFYRSSSELNDSKLSKKTNLEQEEKQSN